MPYLWDTNILLNRVRNAKIFNRLNDKYRFTRDGNLSFISVVTMGEILSLSLQLEWGQRRKEELERFFKQVNIMPIARRPIVDAYAEIDAFSQGKHSSLRLPLGLSARNMGKNDLWIAATAHTTGAKLVTLDNDFDHLDGIFLEVIKS